MRREEEIKNIRSRYSGEHPNDSFVNDIVCNIADDGNYGVQGIPFGFCEKSEEQCFWKKNIVKRYTYLFPYLILNQWLSIMPSSKELVEWIDSYLNENIIGEKGKNIGDKVYEEMKNFIDDIDIFNEIPNIMPEIGFIIDSYLWDKYAEIPSLLHSQNLPDPFIGKYQTFLLNSLKANRWNYQNEIEKYLQFCYVLDSKTKNKKTALEEMLAMTCDKKFDKLEDILPIYPYYGDDFGLALLDFCKKNKSLYELSCEIISKYEFHFEFESWMAEIETRIKETGRPYNIELSKNTNAHKKIVEYLHSRYITFWKKCNRITLNIVDEVKISSSTTKQNDLKEKISDKMKELCNEEKSFIMLEISNLIQEARQEAISLFISETKESAITEGKQVLLTELVSSSIYETLKATYIDSDTPEFTNDSGTDYLTYATKISEIWIEHNIFSPDEMKNVDRSSNDYLEAIKDIIADDVWEIICDEIYKCCDEFYDRGVIHESNSYNYYSSDDSFSNDNSFDYTMGLTGLLGG